MDRQWYVCVSVGVWALNKYKDRTFSQADKANVETTQRILSIIWAIIRAGKELSTISIGVFAFSLLFGLIRKNPSGFYKYQKLNLS